MRDHVRILGYLHIVLSGLGILGALAVLLVFGGAVGLVGMTNPPHSDAWRIGIPVIGVVGTAIAALVLLLSVPGLIAGVGLLKFRPWARLLTIVLSALNLVNVPVGTALGIYGLWVLLQAETERLFDQAPRPYGAGPA
ncbi:MAG: hypothetical protein IT159_05245 [Bryobacterales bacterium]|nr:hypothetical protein [Bryobacterales bacterium]